MPYTWPKERRLLGTKVQRLDGPEKEPAEPNIASTSIDLVCCTPRSFAARMPMPNSRAWTHQQQKKCPDSRPCT